MCKNKKDGMTLPYVILAFLTHLNSSYFTLSYFPQTILFSILSLRFVIGQRGGEILERKIKVRKIK